MKKLLGVLALLTCFCLQTPAAAQERPAVPATPAASAVVLTVSADGAVHIQHAAAGTPMEVYNIVGIKLLTRRIESANETVRLNLPKGYYIFKIGTVVRKVVIR
ncbi:MAG: T9SS type A sorting domain-containing protein [Prevotellaceae bacterium]|jgi:hypothetical protein|nr:T9SS type A sorting domain-containing protein [Prevotellaceae bacterium]